MKGSVGTAWTRCIERESNDVQMKDGLRCITNDEHQMSQERVRMNKMYDLVSVIVTLNEIGGRRKAFLLKII